MSGHSHWKTIKYKKGATDSKKGRTFSKLSRQITMAVKESGSSLQTNPKLKIAVEQARELNMPGENIDRAIKRGTGELEATLLEEVLLEAMGPKGISVLIECITDNKNRTLGEIRQILNQHGGKLANEGSLRWMFNRKGVITIVASALDISGGTPDINRTGASQSAEGLEMAAIDAGAENIEWRGDVLNVYTDPEALAEAKKTLEMKNIKIESSGLYWVARETILIRPDAHQAIEKLFEALDENDAVQEIYSNIKEG